MERKRWKTWTEGEREEKYGRLEQKDRGKKNKEDLDRRREGRGGIQVQIGPAPCSRFPNFPVLSPFSVPWLPWTPYKKATSFSSTFSCAYLNSILF